MEKLFYFFILFFGASIGSFLNSIIYRIYTGESFLFKRSYCPNCKHKLALQDLVPLFSFIILKGKCRYCKKPISWQYPLVELATGILFLFIFNQITIFNLQNFLLSTFYFLIALFLIIIFVYDFKHYIIPDRVIYPAILVSGTWYLVSSIFFNMYTKYYLLSTIYSAVGTASFFFLIFLFSSGKWLGFGDVKLAFLIGLFLGFPKILLALFLAFFIGAIIGIGLIIFGKKRLSSEIPFGPFLVTGTFLAMFWGQNLISWYLNLF